MAETHEVAAGDRMKRWALAYQQLRRGGLSDRAHTAGVSGFDGPEGEFPWITAEDVLALIARVEAAEAAVKRARAALDPHEFDCGRLGLPCTAVSPSDRWCRACRLTDALKADQ